MTTGIPADGPCVPALEGQQQPCSGPHSRNSYTGEAGALQSWEGRGAGGGEGLEEHPAAVFLEGKLFSLRFMTHSSNISSRKASNRIVNDGFSFRQSLSPELF